MKLIKPYTEIIPQADGLEGIYKQIELAGRTCYKSEDKITETSAKEFVDRMIKSGHGAMLEHGTVYLMVTINKYNSIIKYNTNKYSKITSSDGEICYYVTTNYRVLVENDWLSDLQYLCEPTKYHEKRTTVKWVCDRGISHELVRHRVFSFAMESTRYCNYSKDKFGNELTFIIPSWTGILESKGGFENDEEAAWRYIMAEVEDAYNIVIANGWTAQQARSVLPNSLKTELIMTGFESDWKHFFELRSASVAHEQMRELTIPLKEQLLLLNYNI